VSACAIFQEDDKLHMNFSYMHCWKILKDQLKSIERHKHMNALKPPPKPAVKKQKKLQPIQALHYLLLQSLLLMNLLIKIKV
jgi:hypothetical protein